MSIIHQSVIVMLPIISQRILKTYALGLQSKIVNTDKHAVLIKRTNYANISVAVQSYSRSLSE